MILLTSVLFACAAGLLVWTLMDIAFRPRVLPPGTGRFEVERRTQLRRDDTTYRYFEPLVDEWNSLIQIKPQVIEETERHLAGAGIREPWQPAEYLNTKRCESCIIASSCFLIAIAILGMSVFGAFILSLFAYIVMQSSVTQSLKKKATARQLVIKRRFASAIDLMALMMEVGAGFGECLDVAVRENRNNPLGEELALVQKEISMGAVRSKALLGIVDRVRDTDMTEVIKSINEGEELGTPLTGILRNQADQMRMKRSHWAEKAAEESQVAIVFPAMLIMIACLLIVVAPFVLTVLVGGDSL